MDKEIAEIYRKEGYMVRINSRSHGDVLFRVRYLAALEERDVRLCVGRPVLASLQLFFDISRLTRFRISGYQLPGGWGEKIMSVRREYEMCPAVYSCFNVCLISSNFHLAISLWR